MKDRALELGTMTTQTEDFLYWTMSQDNFVDFVQSKAVGIEFSDRGRSTTYASILNILGWEPSSFPAASDGVSNKPPRSKLDVLSGDNWMKDLKSGLDTKATGEMVISIATFLRQLIEDFVNGTMSREDFVDCVQSEAVQILHDTSSFANFSNMAFFLHTIGLAFIGESEAILGPRLTSFFNRFMQYHSMHFSILKEVLRTAGANSIHNGNGTTLVDTAFIRVTISNILSSACSKLFMNADSSGVRLLLADAVGILGLEFCNLASKVIVET